MATLSINAWWLMESWFPVGIVWQEPRQCTSTLVKSVVWRGVLGRAYFPSLQKPFRSKGTLTIHDAVRRLSLLNWRTLHRNTNKSCSGQLVPNLPTSSVPNSINWSTATKQYKNYVAKCIGKNTKLLNVQMCHKKLDPTNPIPIVNFLSTFKITWGNGELEGAAMGHFLFLPSYSGHVNSLHSSPPLPLVEEVD